MARTARPLDGVLLFDKPLKLSSNTALQKVRRLFQAEKAGHTGTLDPMATGLLPICFGESAKFSHALLDADKTYHARIRLGQTSSTGDAEGEITSTHAALPDEEQVRIVLRNFIGAIEQVPPMHSAIKHRGKPLYEYVRKGKSVERPARRVTIHELMLDSFAGDQFEITVRCSKGTYIRALAEDIGHALGCGAYLSGLRRIAIAQFRLDSAYTWEQLDAMSMLQREKILLPVDCLLQGVPMLDLDAGQARRISQGQSLAMEVRRPDGRVRLYSGGEFIGVGVLGEEGRKLVAERLLASAAKRAAMAED
jgi:tRNA pseudouridine55 synthase